MTEIGRSASTGPGSAHPWGIHDAASGSAPATRKAALADPERDFDRLFADGESFAIETPPASARRGPGHALGSIAPVAGPDAAQAHDSPMQPDLGASRADFPGGSVEAPWHSTRTIPALPGAPPDRRPRPRGRRPRGPGPGRRRGRAEGHAPASRGHVEGRRRGAARRPAGAARPDGRRPADDPARRPPAGARGGRPPLFQDPPRPLPRREGDPDA